MASTTNFPEACQGVLRETRLDSNELKALHPEIAEEMKAARDDKGAKNKDKKAPIATGGTGDKDDSKGRQRYQICSDWRSKGSCSAGEQCPNKSDHQARSKNIRSKANSILDKIPENKKPDWKATMKCLMEGGDEAAVRALPAASAK